MLYFKKTELADTYHISDKTVTNWIKEARNGKLDLELYQQDGRAWIANTTRNIALIEQLVEERRKFRNTRGVKVISPKPAFYELYNQEQIFDITTNLDIYHEFPFQYAYFNGGADYWQKYAERLAREETPNFLTTTIDQIRTNQGYINSLLARFKRVNVVDIGVGNALPVKNFIQHLLDQGKMGRYIAIDISGAMLEIAERNIRNWFGTSVTSEGHEADINYDRFGAFLADEVVGEHAKDTVNVIFALGGTFENLRFPDGAFKIIHDSMNRNDLLIYNLKLDNEATRRYFDFGISAERTPLDAQAKLLVDTLNIDESFYDVEMGYDPEKRERYIRIRLKVALTIKFAFEKGERLIEFNKNDTILLWRYWHQNAHEVTAQLERNGFDTLQTSQTEDKDYMLTVSRVKCDR